jgi:tRNA A37 methylthiotransferase MiaB
MNTENIFGSGILYDESALFDKKNYAISTACMSIYSEFLSWANKYNEFTTLDPSKADNIIVLSCQVTDLAILNDLRTIEKLHESFPDKTFFIGGCLANRFDIELPSWVKRLSRICSDYTHIEEKLIINTLHCPIQSDNPHVLKDMGRNVEKTLDFIEFVFFFKRYTSYDTLFATNIIIDYKDFPNPERLEEVFDYVSWNPYWDGKWNRQNAESRWLKYFGK